MNKGLLFKFKVFFVIAITGLCASEYFFHFPSLTNSLKNKSFVNENDEENNIPLKDKMDLAIAQEVALTKDPNTNTVPRERLMAAYVYAQQLRLQNTSGRITGVIPGMNWIERGPSNVGGRTRSIMIDPNDATKKTIWSAGVGGGLWKTTDITIPTPSWSSVNDLFANLAITTLAFNPANTQVMYFGTGEGFFNGDAIRGDGIFQSLNGGTTWSQLASTAGSANFRYIQKIVVHPFSGDVYAATRSGLFRSQNAGLSWSKVLGSGVGATDPVSDIEIATDNSIYVAIGLFSTDGVYKSTSGNAGAWTKINTAGNGFGTTGFSRIELACAPSNASTLYAITQSSATNGIYKILQSTDGGTTWTLKVNPTDADGGIGTDYTRTQAWYDLSVAVDPNNANTLFVGGIDLFKSTNGASSWQQITHWYGGFGFQNVHADQHTAIFEPGNSNIVYFGNDGGIFRSTNGTAAIPTITSKSANYNVTQFYGCAMNPTAYSSQFMAGAQDNGTHQFNSLGINATLQVSGGDGCFTHIDQDQPQYQFSSYVYNNYYRSTNSGASFASITSNNNGSFVNPTDYDDLNNNLYATFGNGNYYVILNAPVSNVFTTVNVAAFNSGLVTHISVSPNTANRVFFGLNNGRIVIVDNANTTTPTAVNIAVAGMPTGSVSCIAVQTGNDNHLLATYSNYGVTSIWETINGGTSWTSVEGNIPDMPVRWALFNPGNNVQAIIATELGVWSTDLLNGGATNWGPSNNGLANVRTDMLQIRNSDKLVIAATHGRGLFSSDVFTAPYPDFVADKILTYTGKPITFTDASYKSTSWAWDFGDATTASIKNPVKTYTVPGLYTITLQINGSASLQRVKTTYIQVLPNKGIPYLPTAGGNFESNAIDYGSQSFSGTPWERGNSVVAGKNGTFGGTKAWVTGVSAANYLDNTDTRLWTPNFNFSIPGTYMLKFYRKNNFEIGYDGLVLEYSLDRGDNWLPFGNVTASWYDFANSGGATSFPVNQPYFNQLKTTFTLAQYDVSFLGGNSSVAFRFRFKSDGSATAPGVAVDEFEITGPVNTPLPVELVSFTGKPLDSSNELSWITLSEVNNDHFELERSKTGESFEKIGYIKGNGTTSTESDYFFTDNNVGSNNFYYRLKQINYDGIADYSGVILVRRESKNENGIAFIYPNPFHSELNIVLQKEIKTPVLVQLYDFKGIEIISENITPSGNQLKLSLQGIHDVPGTYLLKVSYEGKSYTRKVFRY